MKAGAEAVPATAMYAGWTGDDGRVGALTGWGHLSIGPGQVLEREGPPRDGELQDAALTERPLPSLRAGVEWAESSQRMRTVRKDRTQATPTGACDGTCRKLTLEAAPQGSFLDQMPPFKSHPFLGELRCSPTRAHAPRKQAPSGSPGPWHHPSSCAWSSGHSRLIHPRLQPGRPSLRLAAWLPLLPTPASPAPAASLYLSPLSASPNPWSGPGRPGRTGQCPPGPWYR